METDTETHSQVKLGSLLKRRRKDFMSHRDKDITGMPTDSTNLNS